MDNDTIATYFIWKCGITHCYNFIQLPEFVSGCKALGVDSIESIKENINKWRTDLRSDQTAKDHYKWAYTFICQEGFNTPDIDSAVASWEQIIASKCKFFDDWAKFLNKKKDDGKLKAISKDLWNQFYDLVSETQGDMKNFVDDGCWSSLIDEFYSQYS